MSDAPEGLDQVLRTLQRVAVVAPQQAAAALYKVGLAIEQASRARTPVKTGAARDSHRTLQPVIKGNEITVAVVAGGPSAPYVPQLHEDLDDKHDNGQPKFLEISLNEATPRAAGEVAKGIRLG